MKPIELVLFTNSYFRLDKLYFLPAEEWATSACNPTPFQPVLICYCAHMEIMKPNSKQYILKRQGRREIPHFFIYRSVINITERLFALPFHFPAWQFVSKGHFIYILVPPANHRWRHSLILRATQELGRHLVANFRRKLISRRPWGRHLPHMQEQPWGVVGTVTWSSIMSHILNAVTLQPPSTQQGN